jgi:hypothetical protein
MEAHNNTGSVHFFDGFYELDEVKLFYLVFHLIITFIGPSLLYSIIWYENYGSDAHYRTVINILLSHICWISLFKCLTDRILYVIMIAFGPFSTSACDFLTAANRYSFLYMFKEVLLWQLMKYLYIFHWGSMALIDDNFISIFVTLLNFLLSAVFIIASFMIGFNNAEIEYHICTGTDPTMNIIQSPFLMTALNKTESIYVEVVKMDPLVKLFRLIFMLLLVLVVKIWIYDKKTRFTRLLNLLKNRHRTAPADESGDSKHGNASAQDKYNFLQKTKTNIIGASGTLVTVLLIFLLLVPSMILRNIGVSNIESINHGTGRLQMYLSRVTLPLLFYCVLPLVVIAGNSKMRKSIRREIMSHFTQ